MMKKNWFLLLFAATYGVVPIAGDKFPYNGSDTEGLLENHPECEVYQLCPCFIIATPPRRVREELELGIPATMKILPGKETLVICATTAEGTERIALGLSKKEENKVYCNYRGSVYYSGNDMVTDIKVGENLDRITFFVTGYNVEPRQFIPQSAPTLITFTKGSNGLFVNDIGDTLVLYMLNNKIFNFSQIRLSPLDCVVRTRFIKPSGASATSEELLHEELLPVFSVIEEEEAGTEEKVIFGFGPYAVLATGRMIPEHLQVRFLGQPILSIEYEELDNGRVAIQFMLPDGLRSFYPGGGESEDTPRNNIPRLLLEVMIIKTPNFNRAGVLGLPMPEAVEGCRDLIPVNEDGNPSFFQLAYNFIKNPLYTPETVFEPVAAVPTAQEEAAREELEPRA